MELFTKLHDDGQTVVLVTHEPDISTYAERVVLFLDGNMVSDRRQTPVRHQIESDGTIAAVVAPETTAIGADESAAPE